MFKNSLNHTKLVSVLRVTMLLATTLAFATPERAPSARLLVSVATSMHDALVEIAGLYRAATGVQVDVNAAGSNTLARQIVAGAKVDLFLSADEIQMEVVGQADRLVPGTRVALLTNELVVIVPAGTRSSLTVADLAGPGVARIAMGEPASVPAGVYGRRWLEREGVWPAIAPKVVPFPTARGALAAVEAGRVAAGIVYRTDAIGRPGLTVALTVSSRPKTSVSVVHSAAAIRGVNEAEARRFLQYLQSPPAREVFTRRGFGIP